MGSNNEFEDELHSKLLDLQAKTLADRESKVSVNEIQRRLDRFMIDWSARFIEEREARLAMNRVDAENAHPDVGSDRTILAEKERGRNVIADIKPAETAVIERISELRDATFKAVLDIQKGYELNLSILRGAEKQAEMSMPSPAEIRQRRNELANKLPKPRIGQQRDKENDPF